MLPFVVLCFWICYISFLFPYTMTSIKVELNETAYQKIIFENLNFHISQLFKNTGLQGEFFLQTTNQTNSYSITIKIRFFSRIISQKPWYFQYAYVFISNWGQVSALKVAYILKIFGA